MSGRREKFMNMLGEYQCADCGEWKSFANEFYPYNKTYCKVCQRARSRYSSERERTKRFEERQELARLQLIEQLAQLKARAEEHLEPYIPPDQRRSKEEREWINEVPDWLREDSDGGNSA